MRKRDWLKLGGAPVIHVKRTMENRIVYCANCDANRTLSVSTCGNLACSSCGSENWMYTSAPLAANFQEYSEQRAQERIVVERYLDKWESEIFFTPNSALV